MTYLLEKAVCKEWGSIFQVGIPESTRTPCSSCDATIREISEGIVLGFTAKTYLGLKHKRGPGKPIFESMHKPDFHRRSGRMTELRRVIDRENNHYKEIINDPLTGEIVHFCEEPLTEHRGHGSVKLKPQRH